MHVCCVLSPFSRVQLFVTPWTVATRLLCPWDFPGKNTGVDCHFLLQGIFPTQGSNPGLLHCRWMLYCLSHQGSPISDQLCANENFSEILFYICSPGKIKIVLKVKVKSLSRVQLFVTPWTVATRLLCPWDFPGNSTGVDCHFLLQGMFPTQGLNPGLPHCRQTLYPLSHQGSHWQRCTSTRILIPCSWN